jgi:DNA-binding phage protein
MSTLYDRVAAKPGGEAALAAARLRREVLTALHEAFQASSLGSQSAIARRLGVRRSAVNQVLRGDGNLRINTVAEYLHALGFELDVKLVPAGEPMRAELEAPAPRGARAASNREQQVGGKATVRLRPSR